MGIDMLPINANMLYTLVGAAIWAGVMTQWIKHYLADWRWTNLLALGLTLLLMVPVGIFIIKDGALGERILNGVLMSVFGTALATWGYEGIMNILGLLGVGSRK